jgi:hypothetical protein
MTRRESRDPDRAWRGRVILFGCTVIGASFVLYVITGQTPSIFVGAGIALVGTGLSPKLSQMLTAPSDYEPPPERLPDPDWRQEQDWRQERSRRARRDNRR